MVMKTHDGMVTGVQEYTGAGSMALELWLKILTLDTIQGMFFTKELVKINLQKTGVKNRRYPSLKPVGNLVKKFIEHARARHVSVFPIQNLMKYAVLLCILQKKKKKKIKKTLRFLQVSLRNAKEISN